MTTIDALNLAVRMLREIAKGGSYTGREYHENLDIIETALSGAVLTETEAMARLVHAVLTAPADCDGMTYAVAIPVDIYNAAARSR